MNKRLLAVIFFSIIILSGYRMLLNKLYPSMKKTPSAGGEMLQEYPAAEIHKEKEISPESIVSYDTVVETDKYIVTFTKLGGSIREIRLKEYPVRVNGDILTPIIETTSPALSALAIDGVMAGIKPAEKLFNLIERRGNNITYAYKEDGRFEIIKNFSIEDSGYAIHLSLTIRNLSENETLFSYGLTSGSRFGQTKNKMEKRFIEVNSFIDDKILKDTPRKVRKKEVVYSGSIKWTGFKNQYFTLLLHPIIPPKEVFVRSAGVDNLQCGIRTQDFLIKRKSAVTHTYILYAGPKKKELLSAYQVGFERVISYGIFSGISTIILAILQFFYRLTHNYGAAIILLTIMINLILYPLSSKSLHSMRKMQKIQPHVNKLKDDHKDSPHKLNKAIMELYKEHKVNPLGGCLPMLLQMPIFIALYQALMRTIDLKGASFLWIKDLSAPDAIPLPFTLPVIGNSFNLLPLLMIGAMILQQKFSTHAGAGTQSKEQIAQQKMMTTMMPLVFGLIFYNLPSGLVLYWLVNTIIMTVNQYRISKSSA